MALGDYLDKAKNLFLGKNDDDYEYDDYDYEDEEENEAEPTPVAPVAPVAEPAAVETPARPVEEASAPAQAAEGEVVESPLVGVAYLSPSPEKPAFVSVGDTVKKGQTLLIVEAMKVMNEVPAPKDGVITEILVANEEVVDYGKGLVRIK